eukprot:TRINITY_DN1986_c0_g1_i1.p1 TRINITY_DN1986_c0_g1~~TRINITY_DN1986_c0_g1_i1.p1  ORF type:complete len:257 (+),score=61.52 TRINITY_DN1986_c0_g1_i1:32-802(+)
MIRGGVVNGVRMYDTHCHLPMDVYDEGVLDGGRKVLCGIHETDWERMRCVEEKSGGDVRVGYGLHPWWAGERSEGWLAVLEAYLQKSPSCIVGEIGLDKLKGPKMDEQVQLFTQQLALAVKYNRPCSIHCVKAFGAIEAVFSSKTHPLPNTLILHSWAGSPDTTNLLLRKLKKASPTSTLYFGFSHLNMRSGDKFAALVKAVPRERILIESDSHDYKKSWELVWEVVRTVAEVLQEEPEEVLRVTNENAERAYGNM